MNQVDKIKTAIFSHPYNKLLAAHIFQHPHPNPYMLKQPEYYIFKYDRITGLFWVI